MRFEAKQIKKVLSAPVGVSSFTANGANDVVTTALTNALTTAGAGGVSVPLQKASDDFTTGVSVGGISPITLTATGDSISDGAGNQVYGRVTEAGGVYTLTYYSSVAGVETAYSFVADTVISFNFCYQFDFKDLPTKAICSSTSRNIADDLASANGAPYPEQRTPTATNTIPNLTKIPTAGTPIFCMVNGKVEKTLSGGAVSVVGKVVTWNAANAGYDVNTTDDVWFAYFTRE